MCIGRLDVLLLVASTAAFITVVEQTAQVELRAVLINCEPEDGDNNSYDDETARFEREELFKHNVLKDCRKKLTLTVKSVSDPDNSGDEYIPIEHVFRGPQKRIRLLNPYVLRLQREPPLQAYRLRKIDTVSGTIHNEDTEMRVKRSLTVSDAVPFGIRLHNFSDPYESLSPKACFNENHGSSTFPFGKKLWANNRAKRQNDYIVNTEADDNKAVRALHEPSNAVEGQEDDDIVFDRKVIFNDITEPSVSTQTNDWTIETDDSQKSKTSAIYNLKDPDPNSLEDPHFNEIYPNKIINIQKNLGDQAYDMYDIGNADLWYTIQVQLFEKLSTPGGKTEWNDLSRGTPASSLVLCRVNSLNPEWTGPDMSVKYRSSEWLSRSEFTLPMTTLCLLAPVRKAVPSNAGEYIVVPREDVVISSENNEKVLGKNTEFSSLIEPPKQKEQATRHVNIRTSRALFASEKMRITNRDGDPFLTILHKRPYHAQIDLEARADGNQLVYVGSSGRLMTVVADSSRQTRTVITVQATNTGLAAARFRVVARDCNPELPDIMAEKDNNNEEVDGYVLLPPKHTRKLLLHLPFEIPVDTAHCSVALINSDGHSVAVRDVAIRKGDRCFCVWHCECVCLGEDPKLLCREMSEARQIAAGLTLHERTRSVRSVCYRDVMTINICVSSFGVLSTLFLFGFIKACLGLVFRCIGSWGLNYIIQMPRKLDHYYELNLRDQTVVYDDEGWPVHPETQRRSVRLISWPMEFVLNIVFFIIVPSVIMYDVIRQALCRCKKSTEGALNQTNSKCKDNCCRNVDLQSTKDRGRRRRKPLRRWMTPDAEDLSLRIWQKGIAVHSSVNSDMRPLLREQYCNSGPETAPVHEYCGDSEVDDTEYVLMQMQKSRESLAKTQRKLNSATPTTAEKQLPTQ